MKTIWGAIQLDGLLLWCNIDFTKKQTSITKEEFIRAFKPNNFVPFINSTPQTYNKPFKKTINKESIKIKLYTKKFTELFKEIDELTFKKGIERLADNLYDFLKNENLLKDSN